MKNKGHTGTLFFEHGKYRWSYRFDTCEECGLCKFPHKGRGLCTSCHEKSRMKNINRAYTRKKAGIKFYMKSKLLKILQTPEKTRKKREKTFDVNKYRKTYYSRNGEVLLLLAKIDRRIKNGQSCLKIMIHGKEKYFPFSGIEKPSCMKSPYFPRYEEKKEEFEILRKFYSNLGKN